MGVSREWRRFTNRTEQFLILMIFDAGMLDLKPGDERGASPAACSSFIERQGVERTKSLPVGKVCVFAAS
jgi:hypothetical protein